MGLVAGLLAGGCAHSTVERGLSSPPATSSPTRHTLKELRDRHVIKQELDYSCGAAALATLLSFYFGDFVTEQEILDALLTGLEGEERLRKEVSGFSLLDLKRVAEARGYRAAGFRLTVGQLTRLAAPVIVFVEPLGYKHFAVLRGMDRGRVFLADPARGNLQMSFGRFQDEWSGIIFVLGKAGEESIPSYPLALPSRPRLQPELESVAPMLELGTSVRDLSIRRDGGNARSR